MNNDRALLEAAAKAAGMKLVHAPDDGPYRGCQFIDGKSAAWNPLRDDADAFRLAVKLRIDIEWQDDGSVEAYPRSDEPHFCARESGGNLDAAARRAIVRVAAAMAGKAGEA